MGSSSTLEVVCDDALYRSMFTLLAYFMTLLVGHLNRKIVPKMTYGMLNPVPPYYTTNRSTVSHFTVM